MPPSVLHRLGFRRTLSKPGVLALSGRSGISSAQCPSCSSQYSLVTSFVLRGGTTHAIAKSALHDHNGREAFVDAIFGSFTGDVVSAPEDRVTFGCRIGPIDEQPEPSASAIDAAQPYKDSPTWGRKLSRAEALDHPRVTGFWELVDFLLVHEPVIARHTGYT